MADGDHELDLGDERVAALKVNDVALFHRLVASGDIGAGESFMAGEWDTPDLVALVRFFIANAAALDGPITPDVPASLLRGHPGMRVIVDDTAAGLEG